MGLIIFYILIYSPIILLLSLIISNEYKLFKNESTSEITKEIFTIINIIFIFITPYIYIKGSFFNAILIIVSLFIMNIFLYIKLSLNKENKKKIISIFIGIIISFIALLIIVTGIIGGIIANA
jgi:hypothetical protein